MKGVLDSQEITLPSQWIPRGDLSPPCVVEFDPVCSPEMHPQADVASAFGLNAILLLYSLGLS